LSDIKNIFDIAARGMSAQMVRLNTVASNLANARSVASSDAEAYKAIKAVFKTVYAQSMSMTSLKWIGQRKILSAGPPQS
jgi:flagellar basal-body rod protein FlgC